VILLDLLLAAPPAPPIPGSGTGGGVGGLYGIIAAAVVAIFTGSGFAALITARSTRRSLDSDSLKKVADATVVLLDPMRSEIERLEVRVARLTETADAATKNYEDAEARVRALTIQTNQLTADFERAQLLLKAHGITWP
jgi:uncharacterized membrane protein